MPDEPEVTIDDMIRVCRTFEELARRSGDTELERSWRQTAKSMEESRKLLDEIVQRKSSR